jgi:hypothetical protein
VPLAAAPPDVRKVFDLPEGTHVLAGLCPSRLRRLLCGESPNLSRSQALTGRIDLAAVAQNSL